MIWLDRHIWLISAGCKLDAHMLMTRSKKFFQDSRKFFAAGPREQVAHLEQHKLTNLALGRRRRTSSDPRYRHAT
jgi:hypothetical protein